MGAKVMQLVKEDPTTLLTAMVGLFGAGSITLSSTTTVILIRAA